MINIDTAPDTIARVIATIPGVLDELGTEAAVKPYGAGMHANLQEAVGEGMSPRSVLIAHLTTDLPSGAGTWVHTFVAVINMATNADGLRLARKICIGNPEGSENCFTLTSFFEGCEPPTAISINTSATQRDAIERVQLQFQIIDYSL